MSDWKQQAAKRRDARNAKDDAARAPSKPKNTKQWCKGKKGVEHKPRCMDREPMIMNSGANISEGWKELVCTECGKKLDCWSPPRNWKTTNGKLVWAGREKPEWVK